MPCHDSEHSCQADTRSLELPAMQALEGAKQLFSVSHIEAGTIITDIKYGFPVIIHRSQCDFSCVLVGGVLPCITDQIVEYRFDQATVTLGFQRQALW